MTSWRTIAAGLVVVASCVPAFAQSTALSLAEGAAQFRAGRFSEAGKSWSTSAANAVLQSRDTAMLERAALGNVLATLAYERAGDSAAYDTWANSVRYYVEAGSSWESQRKVLGEQHDRYASVLVNATEGTPKVSELDTLIADMDRTAGLLTYAGPRPGLGNMDVSDTESSVALQYFAGASSDDETLQVAEQSANISPTPLLTESPQGADEPPVLPRGILPPAPAEVVDSTVVLQGGASASLPPATDDAQQSSTVPGVAETASTDAPARAQSRDPRDRTGSWTFVPNDGVTAATEYPNITIPPSGADAGSDVQTAFGQKPKASTVRTDHLLQPPAGAPSFDAADEAAARIAWSYIDANRQAQTGLVNSKQGYAFATVGDIANTLAAYVAAEGLQLIHVERFLAHTRQLLATLQSLPLYNQEMLNREYDARAGRFIDLTGRVSTTGSGWSAYDTGRLLVWLQIVAARYPDLAAPAAAVVQRLNFERMVNGGVLSSLLNSDGTERLIQDVRIGGEQYAATGLALWDVQLPKALSYEQLVPVQLQGRIIGTDRRARAYISPEIFAVAVIEVGGIDGCFERLGLRLLEAQLERGKADGGPTLIADNLLARAPWFVYSSVLAEGEAWRTATYGNESQPLLRTLNTRAAFLWDAVRPIPAVRSLRVKAQAFEHSSTGFFAGRFESGEMNRAITLATQAGVLEALLYVKNGRQPLLTFTNPAAGPCPLQ